MNPRPFNEPDLNLDQALIWLACRNPQLVNNASDLADDKRETWMTFRSRYSRMTTRPKLVWMKPYDAEDALLLALQDGALEPQPGNGWVKPMWFNRARYGHSIDATWFVHRDGGGPDLGPEKAEPRFDGSKLLALFPRRDALAYEVLRPKANKPAAGHANLTASPAARDPEPLPSLRKTVNNDLIHQAIAKVYSAARNQNVKPPNVNEIAEFTNRVLAQQGREATDTKIKELAEDERYKRFRLGQGKRPKGLRPLAQLEI